MTAAKSRVAGVEYALPEKRVTNADLQRLHPDWRMEEVARRTGVLERRVCGPAETASDLAYAACSQLIDRLAIPRSEIGAIILCTQSPDYVMPPSACLLQHRLGLPTTVAAFDYTLACSGFVYGLFIADALVRSGAIDNVLLATADSYSRYLHPDDRSTVTLFGDGGAAALICRAAPDQGGIGRFVLGTDGASASRFMIPAGGARRPRSTEPVLDPRQSPNHVCMDGPGVLAFVRERVPPAVQQLLVESGLTMKDIDLVVFHQASQVSLDYLTRWLAIPPEKTFNGIALVGNAVSASIPIALRDAELSGRLPAGARVMLVSFGVGLSWGACTLNW
jgi:3-oxoacyl-[acyl-carrier-protein] synthase III